MNENKTSHIKQLLERYYDGTTNDAEEKQLREYFAGEDVADELIADRDILRSLSDDSDIDVPADLGSRLSCEIDKWDAREKRRKRFTFGAITGIAASLAIALAVGAWFMRQPVTPESTLSPEEAYAQTEKALMIFANALDKSIEGIETVDQTTERINYQINTHLKQINDI